MIDDQFWLQLLDVHPTPSFPSLLTSLLPFLSPFLSRLSPTSRSNAVFNFLTVQHYEGDLRDLELTFSIDEDVMGQLVTHDLVPGGRVVPVTDGNKGGLVVTFYV